MITYLYIWKNGFDCQLLLPCHITAQISLCKSYSFGKYFYRKDGVINHIFGDVKTDYVLSNYPGKLLIRINRSSFC